MINKSPDNIDIYTITKTYNSNGELVTTETSINVNCSVQMTGGMPNQNINTSGETLNAKYVIYITDKIEIDKLSIETDYNYIIYNEKQYNILSTNFLQKHIEIYV